MKRPRLLTEEEISNQLREIQWELRDGCIYKKYTFSKYMDGLNFLVKVGEMAEELDHHPILTLGYCSLEIYLSTHEPKGISELDFQLGRKIEVFQKTT